MCTWNMSEVGKRTPKKIKNSELFSKKKDDIEAEVEWEMNRKCSNSFALCFFSWHEPTLDMYNV